MGGCFSKTRDDYNEIKGSNPPAQLLEAPVDLMTDTYNGTGRDIAADGMRRRQAEVPDGESV